MEYIRNLLGSFYNFVRLSLSPQQGWTKIKTQILDLTFGNHYMSQTIRTLAKAPEIPTTSLSQMIRIMSYYHSQEKKVVLKILMGLVGALERQKRIQTMWNFSPHHGIQSRM